MQQAIRNSFNSVGTSNWRYGEFRGTSEASEEGAWWGYRHSSFGSGIFISRGNVVAFYLDTGGTFTQRFIFVR